MFVPGSKYCGGECAAGERTCPPEPAAGHGSRELLKINRAQNGGMRFTHILVFTLVFALMLNIASAKYTEYLKVQVFDQNYRAVDGAQVYVQYQLNAVAGQVKTKPKDISASDRGDSSSSCGRTASKPAWSSKWRLSRVPTWRLPRKRW